MDLHNSVLEGDSEISISAIRDRCFSHPACGHLIKDISLSTVSHLSLSIAETLSSHTKPLSSPLSITLSSLQTEILKGFWVWVEIKIKVSQTHNKKWIATVASKWTLVATMIFFKPSTQNTKPIFKEPIFFKPKTHAYEHYHQSHPWLFPLSSVYVWIDGNDSDYFWVIWWICFFFFFFF